MIVLSGALVLVALVLLVFGAVDRNLPYVYASIGVSVLSLLLLLVGILQRRGELSDDDDSATTPVTDTSDERVPAFAGAGEADAGTADLPAPAPGAEPASRRVAGESAVDDGDDVEDDELQDDELQDDELQDDELQDDELEDDEPEDDELDGSGVTVLVVSGRPRYHLEGCRVLRGKEPEPLDRDDARTHGFTPCGVCRPDADEHAAPASAPTGTDDDADEDVSFTEVLFGEQIFADRPVQPVLPVIEPAQDSAVGDAPRPPALRGDDPADDPAVEIGSQPAPAPAPDVVADPDGAADEEPDTGVTEPVAEPVAAEDVPTGAADEQDRSDPDRAPDVAAAAPAADDPDETAVLGATAADADVLVEEPPAPAAASASADEPVATEQAPAAKAPRKRAPAKKAPAKKAPAKKAPAKKAPAEKAPSTRAPAKKASPQPEAAPAPTAGRPVVRAVRADALRLGAPSSGTATTRVSVRAAAPATGGTVVVVPDRDRFHRAECRFARDVPGATTLPKAAASRQGYVPCGVCKP